MGILGIVDKTAATNNTSSAGGIGRYEVKRGWAWKMNFHFPKASAVGTLLGAIAQLDSFTIQLTKTARPSLKVGDIKLVNGNEVYHIAGKASNSGTLSIDFYDAIPNVSASEGGTNLTLESASSLMWKWYTTVYNPVTGMMNLSADYKANATVTLYAPDGGTVERWLYLGCWPNSVEMGSLEYSAEKEMHVGATLTYDKVYRIDASTTQNPTTAEDTYTDSYTAPE